MRPPLALLAVLIVSLCSFLGIADSSSSTSSVRVLTLTSFTTVSPSPAAVTSSELKNPTPTDTAEWYITAGLVVIYTTYPPDASPIELTSTDLTTWTRPGPSSHLTYVLTSTSTMSVPIPQTTGSSSAVNKGTGSTTSHLSPATSTSKSTTTLFSSKTPSSVTASTASVSTVPSNTAHKSTRIAVIIIPVIIGIVAIVGIVSLIWWLRRRRNSKNNKSRSDSTEPLEHPIGEGPNTGIPTGGQRKSVFSLGGKHGSVLSWWPFNSDAVIPTAPLRQALIEEIQATPVRQPARRPERSYQADFETDPVPVELDGEPAVPRDQALTIRQSGSSDRMIAAPIPPKSPDRDLTIYGRNITRSSCEPESLGVKNKLDETTQPRLSNYDGNLSTQSSGSNQHLFTPPVPRIQNGLMTTPTTTWVEPPSRFSTASTSTTSRYRQSNNSRDSPAQVTPNNWVETTSKSAITTRDRSFNAIAPTVKEADILRTVADRDNALAILEGRQQAHATATASSTFGQYRDRDHFYENIVNKALKRSRERQAEIRNRFPFATAPVPGTVNSDTHDVSYTETEGGKIIERVDANNGQGGWM